jgi:hypothetical protein
MVRHQAALASGTLTRVTSGVNLPPSEVILSSELSKHDGEIAEAVQRTSQPVKYV